MDKLYDLKEMLCEELKEYGSKGKLDVGGLEIVDKLAHAIKNIDKIIETYEEDGYSEAMGGSYARCGGSYARGGSYERGGSYARGRSARRDSRGRYSREEGYSRAEDDMDGMVKELKEMMYDLPPEKQKEVQKFITKVEQM